MNQEGSANISLKLEGKSKQIPVNLSFSRSPWGLMINGVLIDDNTKIDKMRVETGTTKQAFILSIKVPLTQLLKGTENQSCPVVRSDERGE